MNFPLPARQFYLPKTVLVFKQTTPPTDERAKLLLRRAAQKAAHDLYFMHVMTQLPFTNIDTLGRYLFGVPGFKGHISVIPYKTIICVELPLAPELGLEEAVELVKKAAAKLGWRLLVVRQNGTIEEVPIMTALVHLCNLLLSQTPVVLDENIFVKDDEWLAFIAPAMEEVEKGNFEALSHPDIHSIVADAVEKTASDLPVRGRYAFGEWLAELVTGFATRFSNEYDVIACENVFGEAAFASPNTTVRIYLLNRDTLAEYLTDIQRGVKAVYEFCSKLE